MRAGLVITAWLVAAPAVEGQVSPAAEEPSPCAFTVVGMTMLLRDSCVTPVSIEVPDGMRLDGDGHAIIAVDPPGGSFRGGVIVARGETASVVNTIVGAAGLAGGCLTGAERLRGIYFEGAGGIIRDNVVQGITRGASRCEEGNGIEVRGRTGGGIPAVVEIAGNAVDQYQKSGILVHGDVDAYLHANAVGASAVQDRLPANAIQVGPDARGRIVSNTISANVFQDGDAAGTGILLIGTAPGTVVSRNTIVGGDVGIYVLANGAAVEENTVTDAGPDGAYDVGIANVGEGNLVRDNVVRGYEYRYYGVTNPPRRRQIE
jgi:hypothetical protein